MVLNGGLLIYQFSLHLTILLPKVCPLTRGIFPLGLLLDELICLYHKRDNNNSQNGEGHRYNDNGGTLGNNTLVKYSIVGVI